MCTFHFSNFILIGEKSKDTDKITVMETDSFLVAAAAVTERLKRHVIFLGCPYS